MVYKIKVAFWIVGLVALVETGLNAQGMLTYVPPVLTSKPCKDTTSLIITTASDAREREKEQKKPYLNTVQIIDADQSWPPRWYNNTPLYTDEMFAEDNSKNLYRFDYIIDAKVDGGYFSYYEILSRQSKGTGQLINPKLAGYILLNEKMEAVDTAKSNTKRRNLYYHDFRINEKGERLVNLRKDTYLDMRDYTDNQDDSAIHCNTDHRQG